MKKLFKYHAYLLVVILTILSTNSCEKETELTANTTRNDTYSHWEQVDYSDFMYEQIKYNYANLKPESFVPEDIRVEYMTHFKQLYSELEGYEFSEVLNILQERKLISKALSQVLNESNVLFETVYNSSPFPDFNAITGALENRMKSLEKEETLSLEERKMAISNLSLIKGVCQYYGEIYPAGGILNTSHDSPDGLRSCTVAERFWCIFGGVATGTLAGMVIGLEVGTAIAGPAGALPTIAAGAVIGATAGLIWGIARKCCVPEVECYAIEGLTVTFFDCSASARYVAWGYGQDDVLLNWSNDWGIPASASTPTTNPNLMIAQIDPNRPVGTTIVSMCTDGSTNTSSIFDYNLADLVTRVSGVFLIGPDQVNPMGENYTYTALGVSNGNFSTNWYINGGVILSSTTNRAIVQWDDDLEEGWIEMEVTNNCPGGESKVLTVHVTGDGPI